MTSTDWHRIRDLFHAANPLGRAKQKEFLATACEDEDLRRVVEGMLEAEATGPLVVEEGLFQAPSEAAPLSPIGETCGPYRIVELVGRGGMADVFLATRLDNANISVALKVLRTAAGGHDLATRFRLEEAVLSRLSHPNIAKLLGGGADGQGRPYLAMEYVDGWPLLEYADEHRLSVPARLELFGQVCDAVQFAHDEQVIHRDLKPSNVVVTEAGRVVLLDFGIAKLLEPLRDGDLAGFVTPAGVRLLTPAHAAPEQVTGDPATPRTDVYGLGLTLYELLARRPALDPHGVNWLEWERLVIEVDPPPPSSVARAADPTMAADLRGELRGTLDAIVSKAIQKDPTLRFPSARSLAEAVSRYIHSNR